MKELIEISTALKDLKAGPCALATVIHVEGSAYRRPGARMLIAQDGRSWGMISGGCLEHDLLEHARSVMNSGQARIVRYDSTSNNDIIFGTGLGCNGIIDVFVEPVTEPFRQSFIDAITHCQQTRTVGAIATVVAGHPDAAGQHAFLTRDGWVGSDRLTPLLLNLHRNTGDTFVFPEDAASDTRVFVQSLAPAWRLVIFGGWLDVVPLVRIAREIGFQVTVVDARARPGSRDVFAEADTVFLCDPVEALVQLRCDERTAAVLMNHHFEHDQAALSALASLSLPFIGMLGPKRRQQKLVEALTADGVLLSEIFLESLHGPVGLDIGAKTPAEIALSIMAEILATVNGRNASPIRDRRAPLHTTTPTQTLAYA